VDVLVTDLSTIPHRDGSTYVHERDARRLAGQHCRVLAAMQDGLEHTLAELAKITRDPEASISARLRDLRKPRFGSHDIQRRYVERGLFRYRLVKQKALFT
jgi:hypothetical protein